MMELLAAIDVMGGRAVRLLRGDLTAPEDFGDPRDVAGRFLEGGARRLHVVDLDAAATGSSGNRDAVLGIVELAHEAHVQVEVGGGARTELDVALLVAAGVDTVVLGTAALEDPDIGVGCARRFPGRVAVALDYRRASDGGFLLSARGWTVRAQIGLEEILDRFDGSGLASFIATAIDRDGALAGPDLDGLARLLDMTDTPLVASGGVSGRADLAALAALRSSSRDRSLGGAVVGRALVDGSLAVEEAMEACVAYE